MTETIHIGVEEKDEVVEIEVEDMYINMLDRFNTNSGGDLSLNDVLLNVLKQIEIESQVEGAIHNDYQKMKAQMRKQNSRQVSPQQEPDTVPEEHHDKEESGPDFMS